MEAIRKQASKLIDQVAKQQQAVVKQFTSGFGQDTSLLNEDEQQCHNKLQMLYASTKAAKHLQRDIARGVEALVAVSYKQMEIVKKLVGDYSNYGKEYQNSDFALARASVDFGNFHNLIENERDILLRNLGQQVFEPLQAMVMSPCLEDARLLTSHYEHIRQDAESQAVDVIRRQLKSMEANASPEVVTKLEHAESKLLDLRKTLSALGREANAAMTDVEAQQQLTTLECLLEMVDAERAYHYNVACVLHKLYNVMVQARKHHESTRHYDSNGSIHSDAVNKDITCQSNDLLSNGQTQKYFFAEVVHSFEAQAEEELSLSVGDYVVVRQIAPNGWSEGESKGQAGWFPSAYVEQREKAPADKVIEPCLPS